MTLSILLLATGCIDGPSGSADPGDQDMDMAAPEPDAGNMQDMGNPQEDMSASPDMNVPEDMSTDMGVDQGQDLDMSPGEDMSAKDMPADMPTECVPGNGNMSAAPYKLCKAADFTAIRDTPGGLFELGDDIIIPPDFDPIPSFTGELRGNGHTIAGLHLTKSTAEDAPCQGMVGYAGSFIHQLDGGRVKDIVFSGVKLGDDSTPIPTMASNCPLIVGGIFGSVLSSVDNRTDGEGGIDNVIVRGLEVHSRALAGGLAGLIQESEITNTHVLGDGTSPATIDVRTSGAGIAYQVTNADISYTSFQGDIAVRTPTATMEHSLFIARMTGTMNKLEHVVARGHIRANALTGNAAGFIAHLLPDSSVNLSMCASEANIDTRAQRVGGFIAEFTGSTNLTPSISLCYSGQLSNSQRTTLAGNDVVGGALGKVSNPNGEDIQLTVIWTHLNLDSANPATMHLGCTFGMADNPGALDISDVHPENPGPMNGFPYLCNGREAIEQPTGATFFQDVGGTYRIRSVERWFAPLRDPNLSLSP